MQDFWTINSIKLTSKLVAPVIFGWWSDLSNDQNFGYFHVWEYTLGLAPCPGCQSPPRIITFLVGDSYKPSFATGILGGGPHLKYSTQLFWGILISHKKDPGIPMNQSESWNSCGHVVMAGFQTIHVIPYEGRMFFFVFCLHRWSVLFIR